MTDCLRVVQKYIYCIVLLGLLALCEENCKKINFHATKTRPVMYSMVMKMVGLDFVLFSYRRSSCCRRSFGLSTARKTNDFYIIIPAVHNMM